MKKVPVILAVVLGILDAALVAGIVLMFLQSRAVDRAGEVSDETSAVITEDFQSNDENYMDQDFETSYSGMVTAKGAAFTGTAKPANEPTPTVTPGNEPVPGSDHTSGMPDNDFIFPDSNTRLITQDEMNQKLTDKEKCQRAVNEIYARHGYQFHEDKNPVDYQYFNSKSWYQALKKYESQEEVRKLFSSTEIDNVDALMAFKESKGWT